jgi:hypothetical protein
MTTTDREFIPQETWETSFTCTTGIKVQNRGEDTRTRLRVAIVCGCCGERFIELQDHPGSLNMYDTEVHFKSMTLAAHSRYTQHAEKKPNESEESDESNA